MGRCRCERGCHYNCAVFFGQRLGPDKYYLLGRWFFLFLSYHQPEGTTHGRFETGGDENISSPRFGDPEGANTVKPDLWRFGRSQHRDEPAEIEGGANLPSLVN